LGLVARQHATALRTIEKNGLDAVVADLRAEGHGDLKPRKRSHARK
jgi:ribosomal protein L28